MNDYIVNELDPVKLAEENLFLIVERDMYKQALENLFNVSESVKIFVNSREKINQPTGSEWYDDKLNEALSVINYVGRVKQ